MILLFDVDGVLIENRAYRAGIQKTVEYFCGRLGLQTDPPSDAEIDVFEAESITVEWDTCGIVAAALVLARLRAESARPGGPAALAALTGDVWQALEVLPRRETPLRVQMDYAGLARRAGAASRASGRLPGRGMLAALLDDVSRESALPQPATADLLEHLLGDVYAIDRAPAMQVFQNYALGDERYAHDYGLPPPVKCEALLEQLDRPLLSARWRDEVLRRRAAGSLHAAIYTARPSLPPAEAGAPVRGYTSEGEIGRDMAGLNGVTMMGLGKLDWWARRVGLVGSNLVKPSPVHCMAAIAAARTGLELESVKAALAVARGDHLRYPLTACAGEAVHVFEDSPSSLGAVARAVELLNRQGLAVSLRRYGIAPAGSPKQATLAETADGVYVDVNAALGECVGL